MSKAIGANAVVKWIDEDEPFGAYFSFGAETDDIDEFGIPDDEIFFYAGNEEWLKELMVPCGEDFIVLSYELVYEYEEELA